MKKKILSAFLAVSLVFGSAAALPQNIFTNQTSISASADVSGDYEYKLLENGTAEITKYNGASTTLSIPSTLGGKKVTSIGYKAFGSCKSLKSVTIPSSVSSIGGFAFVYCTNLASITIPNSVKSFGIDAFDGTQWLTEQQKKNPLVVVNGVLVDGYTCSGKVTIPNSVTSISEGAFGGCRTITDVTIPNSVKNIGDSAFSYCSNLSNINIPNSVTSIGIGAFCSCASLTSIIIPNSVKNINVDTFYGCTNLTSVTIANGVKSIGKSAFHECEKLPGINIPNSVTSIGYGAFYGCTSLKNVTIPSSVKSVENNAFGYYWDYDVENYEKVDGFSIYCVRNTEARRYAIDNKFKFFRITEKIRLSGKSRYETSVEISKASFDNTTTVILASGERYADALAGVPFAKNQCTNSFDGQRVTAKRDSY